MILVVSINGMLARGLPPASLCAVVCVTAADKQLLGGPSMSPVVFDELPAVLFVPAGHIDSGSGVWEIPRTSCTGAC